MKRTKAVEVIIHALSPVSEASSAKQVIPVAKKIVTAVKISLKEGLEAFIIVSALRKIRVSLEANGYQCIRSEMFNGESMIITLAYASTKKRDRANESALPRWQFVKIVWLRFTRGMQEHRAQQHQDLQLLPLR